MNDNTLQEKLTEIGLEVLGQTNAMLAYWDRELICRFANNAYKEWFGIDPKQMVNKMRIDELLGPLFEKNLPYIDEALKGNIQVFERDITLPNGEIRSSIATYRPDIVKNEVRGFFVHVADITPIKNNLNSFKPSNAAEFADNLDNSEKIVRSLQQYLLRGFPGISQLARLHNTSESKLKRDFKNRFNMGVFSYFRKMQMEYTYNFFQENNCQRKQMALMLNFANPSNFSVCYNRYLKERKSEALLKEVYKINEERYRTFITQTPFGIAMTDESLHLIAASAKWFTENELHEIESIGKTLQELLPKGGERADGIYRAALAGENISCEEEFYPTNSGDARYFKWDVRPWFDGKKKIGGIIIHIENITSSKLKETENEKVFEIFEKTSEIARIGAWKWNFITNTGYWSAIAFQILDLPKGFSPTVENTLPLFKKGESFDLMHAAVLAAKTQGISFDIIVDLLTLAGNLKRVRAVGIPVFNSNKCEKLLGIYQELKNDN